MDTKRRRSAVCCCKEARINEVSLKSEWRKRGSRRQPRPARNVDSPATKDSIQDQTQKGKCLLRLRINETISLDKHHGSLNSVPFCCLRAL